MADGRLVMSLDDARAKAGEMIRIASDLETLLNTVSKKMQEIDNVETGTYQGNRKPAELRAELDSFRSMFNLAHEQIVIIIANVAESE